jgi:hypothetical protein
MSSWARTAADERRERSTSDVEESSAQYAVKFAVHVTALARELQGGLQGWCQF